VVASVYVHLPFCRGRCPYCDFVLNDVTDPPTGPYVRALIGEWRWRTFVSGGQDRPVDTAYIGGGTPSLWPAERIVEILRVLPMAEGAEVTIEANPGDADAGWYRGLVDAGVTRFSIGVQAVDGDRLRWLGRRHGVEDAIRAIRLAKAAGARSVSADLIYGTPGHTPAEAADEARALAAQGVDHVSAYELTVAPRTPLGARAAALDLGLPDDDALVELWDAVGGALAEHGLERYEVSSHGRPGHRCRHNENYWRGGAYVGLGSGAHGYAETSAGRLRYANGADLGDYLGAALDGRFPPSGGGLGDGATRDPVDDEARARELVMLGLRWIGGVDLDALARLAGDSRSAAFAAALAGGGHARIVGTRLVPTREGMLLADGLAERF
jgi:putative oxygen-independent coproporphyrinogen III oxidase